MTAEQICPHCGSSVEQVYKAGILWYNIDHEPSDCILFLRYRIETLEALVNDLV